MPFLDAFIIDSGTALVSGGGAAPDSLEGVRFWMWCGERDPDLVNAGEMICDNLAPFLSSYGGTVDGCHGILFDCEQTCADCWPHDGPTEGDLPALFCYLDTLSLE